jgi:Mor family transcriptional regulator
VTFALAPIRTAAAITGISQGKRGIKMGNRKITEKQEEEICSLYRNEMCVAEIAKKYSVSLFPIYACLNRNHIHIDRKLKLSGTQIQEICDKYENKIYASDLSKEYPVSEATIFNYLKRMGFLPLEDNRRKLSDIQIQEICKKYINGESSEKLKKIYGVANQTILCNIRKNNVKVRTNRDYPKKYQFDITVFDEINEESAYWLGVLISDGCVCYSGRGDPKITLSLNDKEHIWKFREFMKSNHPIISCGKQAKQARLTIRSGELAKRLEEYNMTPRKSFTATVPDCLLDNRHFFRGMIDGDGYVVITVKSKKRPNYLYPILGLCGSFNTISQFKDYIRKNFPDCKSDLIKHASIYKIVLGGRFAVEMAKLLYSDCTISLDRKQAIANKIINGEYGNNNTALSI